VKNCTGSSRNWREHGVLVIFFFFIVLGGFLKLAILLLGFLIRLLGVSVVDCQH
jgi:hypothetical protein